MHGVYTMTSSFDVPRQVGIDWLRYPHCCVQTRLDLLRSPCIQVEMIKKGSHGLLSTFSLDLCLVHEEAIAPNEQQLRMEVINRAINARNRREELAS